MKIAVRQEQQSDDKLTFWLKQQHGSDRISLICQLNDEPSGVIAEIRLSGHTDRVYLMRDTIPARLYHRIITDADSKLKVF